MTIKVTNDDVMAAAIACSNADELMKKLPVTDVGMRAALESFVARHSELGGRRAMHEPVSGPEVLEMAAAAAAVAPGEFFFDREERMRAAGNGLLAGRAAPKREPVVVTEEMARECMKDIEWGGGVFRAILDAMNWLADRLNGKHEKPVDPRVAVFTKAMVERGYDLGSVEDFEFILGKLDNAKT